MQVTGLRTGDKFNFRVRPYNDGGYGNACIIENIVEVRQLQGKIYLVLEDY